MGLLLFGNYFFLEFYKGIACPVFKIILLLFYGFYFILIYAGGWFFVNRYFMVNKEIESFTKK